MTYKKYKYRITFTGIDGKRHDIRANSYAEMTDKVAFEKDKLEKRISIVSSDMNFRDWTYKCIETWKTNQSPDTHKKYISRVQHCILEYLGDYRLRDITSMDCQNVINRQEGKSKTQINEVFQALRFLFRHAKLEHLLAYDPTEAMEKPKSSKQTSRRALTDYERRSILKVGRTDRRYFLFLIMLQCGCRPSEAAESKGSDITIIEGIPMLHIRGTKTKFADRLVPIPDDLYSLISMLPKNEYIAVTKLGNKVVGTAYRRIWNSFRRVLNIEMGCKVYNNELIPPFPLAEDLVPYDFRHDYCTQLQKNGVDLRDAQKLMGHSDITLTANIYSHAESEDTAIRAANKLRSINSD